MLMGNSNVRINDWRGEALDTAGSVAKKLAWYLWHDPEISMPLTKRLSGGVEIPTRWTPQSRLGEFSEFDFTINAYAKGNESADERANRLMGWLERVIYPMLPIAAQKGSFPNVDLIANMAGEHLDLDRLDELWIEGEPAGVQAVQQGQSSQDEQQQPQQQSPGGRQPTPVQDMAVASMEAR
jgi:hypothetical protein